MTLLIRVAPAAPEGDRRAEFALQPGRVHLDAVGLHGVDNVIARVNEIRQEPVDRTTGVQKGLHSAVRMDVVHPVSRRQFQKDRPHVALGLPKAIPGAGGDSLGWLGKT